MKAVSKSSFGQGAIAFLPRPDLSPPLWIPEGKHNINLKKMKTRKKLIFVSQWTKSKLKMVFTFQREGVYDDFLQKISNNFHPPVRFIFQVELWVNILSPRKNLKRPGTQIRISQGGGEIRFSPPPLAFCHGFRPLCKIF